MEKTEEILKKQLIDAMEGGKYRILIHRTYTGGDNLDMDGISRSICQSGLRVFDGSSIDFTTSDYRNDINEIMKQIINAYSYKGSDKVFVLKVPVGALEYIPGKSEPILSKGQGRNLYNSGNNCVILPQYIIGYVDVSKNGVSALQPNTCKINTSNQQQIYANSVVSKCRRKNQEFLESIRTDKFYTDEEKMSFLRVLYCNYRKEGKLSKPLMMHIKQLMPASELEQYVWATSTNLDELFMVDRFIKGFTGDTKITKEMLEKEFRKTRKLMATEIYDAIPSLLRKEKSVGRALTGEETIEEISKVYGFNKDIVTKATLPKKKIWDRFKEIFNRTKEQKLLEAPTEQKQQEQEGARQRFVEELKTEEKHIIDKSSSSRKQDSEKERE